MFDLNRYEELMLRHRHADGSWGPLEPAPDTSHDAAASDPERSWDDARLYVCACGEQVQVRVRDQQARPI